MTTMVTSVYSKKNPQKTKTSIEFTSSNRANMSRSMSETGTSRNWAKSSKSNFCPSSFLARFPYSCRTFSVFLGFSLGQQKEPLWVDWLRSATVLRIKFRKVTSGSSSKFKQHFQGNRDALIFSNMWIKKKKTHQGLEKKYIFPLLRLLSCGNILLSRHRSRIQVDHQPFAKLIKWYTYSLQRLHNPLITPPMVSATIWHKIWFPVVLTKHFPSGVCLFFVWFLSVSLLCLFLPFFDGSDALEGSSDSPQSPDQLGVLQQTGVDWQPQLAFCHGQLAVFKWIVGDGNPQGSE